MLTVELATPSLASSYAFYRSLGARLLTSRRAGSFSAPLATGIRLAVSERGPDVPTLVGHESDERLAVGLSHIGGRRRYGVWRWRGERVAVAASRSRQRPAFVAWQVARGRPARLIISGEAAHELGQVLPCLGFYRPRREHPVYRRAGVEVVLEESGGPAFRLEVADAGGVLCGAWAGLTGAAVGAVDVRVDSPEGLACVATRP